MCVVNPLARGHLTPFDDRTRPTVRSVLFENLSGRRIPADALSGAIRMIADVFDRPALPSPSPWLSMPVSPALIRWRLAALSGRVVRSRVAVDFRLSLPPRRDFCQVYAPGTVQNFAAVLGKFHWGQPGRYLYDLTAHPLDTQALPNGRYRLTVDAANIRGGTGSKTVAITIRQQPSIPLPSPAPRPDSRCERSFGPDRGLAAASEG